MEKNKLINQIKQIVDDAADLTEYKELTEILVEFVCTLRTKELTDGIKIKVNKDVTAEVDHLIEFLWEHHGDIEELKKL